jgi:hypothetical protein
MRRLLLLCAGLAALPRLASADERLDDPSAYCRYTHGVADSKSALLFSPRVFFTYGLVNPADSATDGTLSSSSTAQHVLVGLRYSLVDLYQGIALRQLASVECERYRAVSALRSFLVANRGAGSIRALKAKAAVLEGALAEAERILKAATLQVQESRATVEELHATQLRVDELRELTAQNREEIAKAADVAVPKESVHRLLKERDAAEEEEQVLDGRLRESEAFDVQARGGYDQVIGGRPGTLPIFGIVTLSLNLGVFAQFPAEARAREGHRAWVRQETEGVDQRVEETLARLHQVRRIEERRLSETQVLLADLEERLRTVEGLPLKNDKVKKYRDYLWFDFVKVKAESEFLRAHLVDLAISLGEPSRDGSPSGDGS